MGDFTTRQSIRKIESLAGKFEEIDLQLENLGEQIQEEEETTNIEKLDRLELASLLRSKGEKVKGREKITDLQKRAAKISRGLIVEKPKVTDKKLTKMTVQELRKKARERGIKKTGVLRKDELLRLLG